MSDTNETGLFEELLQLLAEEQWESRYMKGAQNRQQYQNRHQRIVELMVRLSLMDGSKRE